jgi:phosphoserine phosphatase
MAHERSLPIAVDLDGTLIAADLLWVSLAKLVRERPCSSVLLPWWALQGRAALKHRVGEALEWSVDVGALPYRSELVEWLAAQAAGGRTVVLATASPQRYANAVASFLGFFCDAMGSTPTRNLKAATKAAALCERFGERGFVYAGDARADWRVWERAAAAIPVSADAAFLREVRKRFEVEREFHLQWPTGGWRPPPDDHS